MSILFLKEVSHLKNISLVIGPIKVSQLDVVSVDLSKVCQKSGTIFVQEKSLEEPMIIQHKSILHHLIHVPQLPSFNLEFLCR